jgi:2-polyprenyl-3-methyl-5-hydroxy-6-metoxy-1,4-benzoquinol methylase
MSLHTNCLICSSSQIHQLPRYYEKHSLVKCRSCSFVFAQRNPTFEELNAHYSNYSYDTEAVLSPLTVESYRKLLDEFEPYRKNGRLLDIGCGRGWFLIEAQKRGWEVYGTEYSDKAVELCEKAGIKMFRGALTSEMFEEGYFDVITSFEVIEHINNPNESLALTYRLLRKKGLFYCTTPNFNSVMRYYLKEKYNVIEYPEHLSYYTKRSLVNVIQRNGFHKIKFLSTGISVSRLKASLSPENATATASSDEKLRENIAGKWYLELAKKMLNGIFTATNTGLTLKGYFIKN